MQLNCFDFFVIVLQPQSITLKNFFFVFERIKDYNFIQKKRFFERWITKMLFHKEFCMIFSNFWNSYLNIFLRCQWTIRGFGLPVVFNERLLYFRNFVRKNQEKSEMQKFNCFFSRLIFCQQSISNYKCVKFISVCFDVSIDRNNMSLKIKVGNFCATHGTRQALFEIFFFKKLA